MRQWQCTVCQYIHVGENPPEQCPVCGAPKEKFVEIEPKEDQIERSKPIEDTKKESQEEIQLTIYSIINENILKHHIHPISVHFPNGVIPLSAIFIVLAFLFGSKTFGDAAFYNMIFVCLSMPAVLYSGYVEWKNKYGGNLTSIFRTKIICAIIVTVLAIITVLWKAIDNQASTYFFFMVINLIMLGAAGIAGFLGGKLVFKEWKNK